MQVKKVPIAKIKPSAHNPKIRTSGPSIAGLTKSIEAIGLVYPLAVSKTMQLIDGHRRLAAAKKLGWSEVPILIVATDDNDLVYAEINAAGRRLSGAENLQVWLRNPGAVTHRAHGNFDKAADLYGIATLKYLAKHNMSLRLLGAANVVAEYIDSLEDIPFRRSIVHWMVGHRMQSVVRAYVTMQQPPKPLYNAIKNNKPLKAHYVS